MKTPRSLKTKNNKFKMENFTLHHEQNQYWKVSGKDSTGKYRRIRFEAKDIFEAVKIAENQLFNPSGDHPTSQTSPEEWSELQIADAMIRAAETRNWTEYTRKCDLKACKRFLDWVDKQGLCYWKELRFEHIDKFKKELLEDNLAYDTIRLYLIPVRRTAAWVSSNWPYHLVNICQNLRLSRRNHISQNYDESSGNPYLSIGQVLDFMEFLLKKNVSSLVMGVALQGLMGLQLKEALRLTWQKVDLNQKTIIIDGAVKNRYRIRKIPLVNIVSDLLSRFKEGKTPDTSVIEGYIDDMNYSRAIKRELNLWNPDHGIKPKDFRNTIQTLAIDEGWYDYYVQRYVGHAPQTIGQRHYHADRGDRLIQFWKEKVVARIDQVIEMWVPPSDSCLIPSQKIDLVHAEMHDYCTIRGKSSRERGGGKIISLVKSRSW